MVLGRSGIFVKETCIGNLYMTIILQYIDPSTQISIAGSGEEP